MTWEETDLALVEIYKLWYELAERQPKQSDKSWEAWDEEMELVVRIPARKIHERRITLVMEKHI